MRRMHVPVLAARGCRFSAAIRFTLAIEML
jgi:hypothetical protein